MYLKKIVLLSRIFSFCLIGGERSRKGEKPFRVYHHFLKNWQKHGRMLNLETIKYTIWKLMKNDIILRWSQVGERFTAEEKNQALKRRSKTKFNHAYVLYMYIWYCTCTLLCHMHNNIITYAYGWIWFETAVQSLSWISWQKKCFKKISI